MDTAAKYREDKLLDEPVYRPVHGLGTVNKYGNVSKITDRLINNYCFSFDVFIFSCSCVDTDAILDLFR